MKSFQMTNKYEVKGTLIFWMAVCFGFLGIHCFMSKRYGRGALYILIGGVPYFILNEIFGKSLNIVLFDIGCLGNVLFTFFNVRDVISISTSNYVNLKSGALYLGSKWMNVVAFIFTLVQLFAVINTMNYLLRKLVNFFGG